MSRASASSTCQCQCQHASRRRVPTVYEACQGGGQLLKPPGRLRAGHTRTHSPDRGRNALKKTAYEPTRRNRTEPAMSAYPAAGLGHRPSAELLARILSHAFMFRLKARGTHCSRGSALAYQLGWGLCVWRRRMGAFAMVMVAVEVQAVLVARTS